MSDLFGDNDELLISPGELWDRLTILEIKIQKIDNEDKVTIAGHEWRNISLILERIHHHKQPEWPWLIRALDRLRRQNLIQWECEDRVRSEQSWEAAQAARDSNTKRVAIKNAINKMYQYLIDVKEYAGENDDS